MSGLALAVREDNPNGRPACTTDWLHGWGHGKLVCFADVMCQRPPRHAPELCDVLCGNSMTTDRDRENLVVRRRVEPARHGNPIPRRATPVASISEPSPQICDHNSTADFLARSSARPRANHLDLFYGQFWDFSTRHSDIVDESCRVRRSRQKSRSALLTVCWSQEPYTPSARQSPIPRAPPARLAYGRIALGSRSGDGHRTESLAVEQKEPVLVCRCRERTMLSTWCRRRARLRDEGGWGAVSRLGVADD